MVISIPFSSRENSILNVHIRWAPNCSWLWKNLLFLLICFAEWSRISREVKQIKSTETTRLETNASRCCLYAIYVHMLILPPDNQRKLRPRANVLTNYTCQRFHFDFWIRFSYLAAKTKTISWIESRLPRTGSRSTSGNLSRLRFLLHSRETL